MIWYNIIVKYYIIQYANIDIYIYIYTVSFTVILLSTCLQGKGSHGDGSESISLAVPFLEPSGTCQSFLWRDRWVGESQNRSPAVNGWVIHQTSVTLMMRNKDNHVKPRNAAHTDIFQILTLYESRQSGAFHTFAASCWMMAMESQAHVQYCPITGGNMKKPTSGPLWHYGLDRTPPSDHLVSFGPSGKPNHSRSSRQFGAPGPFQSFFSQEPWPWHGLKVSSFWHGEVLDINGQKISIYIYIYYILTLLNHICHIITYITY